MKPSLSRKAVSPLIATMILIAICVAGGLLIYNVFFSTSGIITAKGQLTIEAMDLVKQTDGSTVFSITIKNSGNKPITDEKGLNVTLVNEKYNITLPSGGLQPGQSVACVKTLSPSTFVVGNSYTVIIEAKFSDGSTFALTTSVQCRLG